MHHSSSLKSASIPAHDVSWPWKSHLPAVKHLPEGFNNYYYPLMPGISDSLKSHHTIPSHSKGSVQTSVGNLRCQDSPAAHQKSSITEAAEATLEAGSQFPDDSSAMLKIEMNTRQAVSPHSGVRHLHLNVKETYDSKDDSYSSQRSSSYKCNICDKELIDEQSLSSHLTLHSQRCKVRKCDYCDTTFSSKGKWYAHFKSHFSDPSFHCALCNFSFVAKQYLQIHLSGHVRDHCPPHTIFEDRKYPCTFCGKVFTDRPGILYHLRIHTSDIVYTCTHCGKIFLNRSELNLHTRVHTGDKSHSCEVCRKTFLTSSNLKQHIRTHTGDKPYDCSNCDKSFSNKSNLAQHMKVHTGEKPYGCTFCEKSFTTPSNLKQHLRIHTGDKPFKCFCGKFFTSNSNLSQHRKVHGIYPNRCAATLPL